MRMEVQGRRKTKWKEKWMNCAKEDKTKISMKTLYKTDPIKFWKIK